MAKKLTSAFVRTVATAGKYSDEHGLMLRVLPSGSKQWVQRIVVRGRRCDIGLGGYPIVMLAQARETALENRRLARAGGDPLALRAQPDVPTFEAAAAAVIELHAATWKDSGKSAAQWRASLDTYAMPRLGTMPVNRIGMGDVMAVLLPIWNDKRETARRVRQRIRAILQWAIAKGYRTDNPAGDAIAAALPKNGNVVQHQRAIPHCEVAAAIRAVHGSDAGVSTRLAFEFLVLTAARSGEVRGARWDEIDLDAATWTVPAERMKGGRPHRVPLSARALAVLAESAEIADGAGLVFPGSRRGKPLSENTMGKVIRDLGIPCVTHGFRSSFRDWAAESTNTPREVCEAALAHTVRDRVEAAYNRTDLFNRRRALMEQWALYVGTDAGARVVPMARRGG